MRMVVLQYLLTLFGNITANDLRMMFTLLRLGCAGGNFVVNIIYAGVDLISGVTCDAPYEWPDKTDSEWEFKTDQTSGAFHVSIGTLFFFLYTQNIPRT